MKIALISDIHANYFFLDEVLAEIDKYEVQKIFCLGDLVGYYNNPNEVIELIRKKNILCVKGNHDKYLLGELEYKYQAEDLYRIIKHREELFPENFEYLSGLPDSIDLIINEKKIFLTHSLPNNSEEYFREYEQIDRDFIKKYDYYFFGHTHIPACFYSHGVCFINPGSVGQPRDYTQKASFALVDFIEDSIQIKKVSIDFLNFCEKLEQLNFNNKVISIIKRKK